MLGLVWRAACHAGDMHTASRVGFAAALLACTLFGESPDAGAPIFQSETRLVEVTIVATDRRGRPLRDLTLDDIQLLDNRVPQEVQSFQRTATRSEFVRARRQAAYRHSVIFIDAVNTDPSDQRRVRKAVAKVLKNIDAKEERVAVFLFTGEVTVLHNFLDSDHALEILAKDLVFSAGSGSDRRQSEGGWYWYSMFNGTLRREHELKRRAVGTLRALGIAAESVSHIPGQKNLIWISAGFPIRVDDGASKQGSMSAARSNQQQATSPKFMTSNVVSSREMDLLTRSLNASNINLYPIAAQGLTVAPDAGGRIGVMKYLSDRTGGRSYYDRNDLGALVSAALADSRGSYVLSYSPNNYREDKPLHRIAIKSIRPGIKLRYRRTYYSDWRKLRVWHSQQEADDQPFLPTIPVYLWSQDAGPNVAAGSTQR